jgi:hypothetical protein
MNGIGGSVALYIQNTLKYIIHDEYWFSNRSETESLFTELDGNGSTDKLLGVIYRPPNSNVRLFLE